MEEVKEVIDGVLTITRTPEPMVETLTKEDVVGKRAEAQTVVDNLIIDLAAAQAEVDKLDAYLVEIDKVVEPK